MTTHYAEPIIATPKKSWRSRTPDPWGQSALRRATTCWPAGVEAALRPFGDVWNRGSPTPVPLPKPDSTPGQCCQSNAAAQDGIQAKTGQPSATRTTGTDQTNSNQHGPDQGHDKGRATGSASRDSSTDSKFARDHGILQFDGLLWHNT